MQKELQQLGGAGAGVRSPLTLVSAALSAPGARLTAMGDGERGLCRAPRAPCQHLAGCSLLCTLVACPPRALRCSSRGDRPPLASPPLLLPVGAANCASFPTQRQPGGQPPPPQRGKGARGEIRAEQLCSLLTPCSGRMGSAGEAVAVTTSQRCLGARHQTAAGQSRSWVAPGSKDPR